MSEKIIDEVMVMISEYGDRCWTNDSVTGMEEAIRAKLSEVLERKPMSDERITEIFDDHHADMSRGRIKEI